jgi:hypothetical protein
MKALMRQRFKSESGSIMVITVAFLAFAGVTVAALLNYSSTALGATNRLASLRGTDYDADGALEAAIARIRNSTSEGYFGSCTPYTPSSASLTVNNSSVPLRVDCSPKFAPLLQREVLLSVCPTSVSTSTCTAENSTSWLSRAHVKFLDGLSSGGFGGIVYVDTWSTAP